MPKLILLGTNDPYWSVDAAGVYFHDLPSPGHLYYAANTGHGLGSSIVPTLEAFVRATRDRKELPSFTWETTNERLVAAWEGDAEAVLVWEARSPSRDFHRAVWSSRQVAHASEASVPLPTEEEQYSARYLEVRFHREGETFGLTTEIVVTPPGVKAASN